MFVSDELRFDQDFDRAEDIYRLTIDAEIGGNTQHFAIAPFAALPAFRDELAAITIGARAGQWGGQVLVDGENFEEEGIIRVDTSFFEVFSTKFISGDPTTVLDEPGAVVVTKATAERRFGTVDAVGKRLTINDIDMAVTGVVENPSSPVPTGRRSNHSWPRFMKSGPAPGEEMLESDSPSICSRLPTSICIRS